MLNHMLKTGRIAVGTVAALAILAAAANAAEAKKSTTDEVADTAVNIVNKPLEDANLKKTDIPPILVKATANPYSMAGISSCPSFKAEIDALTAVLGPDVDSPNPKGKGSSSTEKMLNTTQEIAGSLIPYGGVIRAVSGANDAKKKAAAAVLAGSIRRAYLKGSGRAKGCKL